MYMIDSISKIFKFVYVLFSKGGNLEMSKDVDENWYGNIFLKKWFRTSKAIVLYLNDGTLQVRI